MAKTLYTLSAVAEKTGISMNSLLRYKKQHQRRIPSVGKGRTQRYPKEAFVVFTQIKDENLAKRGGKKRARRKPTRKRVPAKMAKKTQSSRRRKTSSARAGSEELLTLSRVAEKAQISYGTAVRYAQVHAAKIPSKGSGRKRRYPEEAVALFKRLRSESKPGRKPGAKKRAVRRGTAPKRATSRETDVSNAALSKQIAKLEKALLGVSKQLQQLTREVKKPIKVTLSG